jgi:hypothetical protein
MTQQPVLYLHESGAFLEQNVSGLSTADATGKVDGESEVRQRHRRRRAGPSSPCEGLIEQRKGGRAARGCGQDLRALAWGNAASILDISEPPNHALSLSLSLNYQVP